MRFRVLGPLMVRDAEGAPVRVPEAKVRALLADLLVHEGRPVSVDRLLADLWGEELPGKPANALQNKVSQLRRAIGRDRVVHQSPGYLLRLREGDEVDAGRFRHLVERARRTAGAEARTALLLEALGLWRGPAYADFADALFVTAPAARLEELRLTAREELAFSRLELGEHALVAGELSELVAEHPLRERLRAAQLRALYGSGRQSEALAAYDELRGRLAEELGLDPGPELVALHQAILRQDPALSPRPAEPLGRTGGPGARHEPAPDARPESPEDVDAGGPRARGTANAGPASPAPAPAPTASAPAPRPVPARSGAPASPAARPAGPDARPDRPSAAEAGRTPATLPVPLTPLIGRDAAVSALVQRLAGARLVTLTGPGGVGKTRLAVETASRLGGTFPDGVWLVELAGQCGGSADLAETVAAALGIRDDGAAALPGPSGPEVAADRLAAALRDRRALMILDNCEQVVGPAADLTGQLLRTAPGLHVLATSQEPLGVPGEVLHTVEPLPTDDAVRLFAERAAAAAPGFVLDDGNAAYVAEICRRLDGIPLALELAATRVRALGVQELAARLGDRFRVLGTGLRGAPARQRTLRAMIDWSWELLSAPERIVLRRLAVHADGCTLEAAEAVCAGDGVTAGEVLDLLIRLVDRSLVVRAEDRYRLLESVAAYATEQLHDLEDFARVRARHLDHYLRLAERTAPRLRGAGQREALALLGAETANLRAAFEEALRRRPADRALRLAAALSWYWLLSGRLHEARRSLAAALDAGARPHEARQDSLYAEVRTLHTAFALLCGEKPEQPDGGGPAGSGGGLRDHERIEDPARRSRATVLLALGVFYTSADLTESERLTGLALATSRAAGDTWGTAAALGLRALHALLRGDLETIRRDGERSAALFAGLGDGWGRLQAIGPLAALAEINGAYREATALHREGLRIAEDLGLAAEVCVRLSGLGRLALLDRDWEGARALHERSLRSAAEHGYRFGEVYAEMGLALGARRTGRLDEAERLLLGIRDWYAEVSTEAGNHLVFAELGFIAEERGDIEAARSWHREGLEAARLIGDPRSVALALEGLAGVAVPAGRAERAAHLLGAADATRRRAGAALPAAERTDVERVGSAARRALGDDPYAAAFAHGSALPLPEAIAIARTV